MLKNKNGYEIPEWRIESNEKQVQFEGRLNEIVKALAECGHTGWVVEHTVDPDSDFYAGLKTYYGTARFICKRKNGEPFQLVLNMSSRRGIGQERNKAFVSVSHGELEKYYDISRDTIRAGFDISRDAQGIAREIIRKLIFPARDQHNELITRKEQESTRQYRIERVCDVMITATSASAKVTEPHRMKDKNKGAEFSYWGNEYINFEGSVSYNADGVDLLLKDLSVEQARVILHWLYSRENFKAPASKQH